MSGAISTNGLSDEIYQHALNMETSLGRELKSDLLSNEANQICEKSIALLKQCDEDPKKMVGIRMTMGKLIEILKNKLDLFDLPVLFKSLKALRMVTELSGLESLTNKRPIEEKRFDELKKIAAKAKKQFRQGIHPDQIGVPSEVARFETSSLKNAAKLFSLDVSAVDKLLGPTMNIGSGIISAIITGKPSSGIIEPLSAFYKYRKDSKISLWYKEAWQLRWESNYKTYTEQDIVNIIDISKNNLAKSLRQTFGRQKVRRYRYIVIEVLMNIYINSSDEKIQALVLNGIGEIPQKDNKGEYAKTLVYSQWALLQLNEYKKGDSRVVDEANKLRMEGEECKNAFDKELQDLQKPEEGAEASKELDDKLRQKLMIENALKLINNFSPLFSAVAPIVSNAVKEAIDNK